jgi:hypothetical protein
MIKYLAIAAVAAGSFLFVSPDAAQAAYCEARSAYAYGWGQGSLSYARRRALSECAVRTPRGYYCRITRCTY